MKIPIDEGDWKSLIRLLLSFETKMISLTHELSDVKRRVEGLEARVYSLDEKTIETLGSRVSEGP